MKYSKICLVAVSLVFFGIGIPVEARAHGPTIKISHEALSPSLLNLYVGTTVHFLNTASMPGGHVVVIKATGAAEGDKEKAVEGPALEEPGDDWHYTFEDEGTFDVYVKQHPAAKARIVVVPKR